MFHTLHASTLRDRVLRGMAFFFILFTLADVSFLAPCSELNESRIGASQHLVQQVSVADHPEAVKTNDSSSDESPDKSCCDEDCCFFCAHVLSAVGVTQLRVVDAKPAFVMTADKFVPEPPLRSPYHPPRFA